MEKLHELFILFQGVTYRVFQKQGSKKTAVSVSVNRKKNPSDMEHPVITCSTAKHSLMKYSKYKNKECFIVNHFIK